MAASRNGCRNRSAGVRGARDREDVAERTAPVADVPAPMMSPPSTIASAKTPNAPGLFGVSTRMIEVVPIGATPIRCLFCF
jgi:hypothetical protein